MSDLAIRTSQNALRLVSSIHSPQSAVRYHLEDQEQKQFRQWQNSNHRQNSTGRRGDSVESEFSDSTVEGVTLAQCAREVVDIHHDLVRERGIAEAKLERCLEWEKRLEKLEDTLSYRECELMMREAAVMLHEEKEQQEKQQHQQQQQFGSINNSTAANATSKGDSDKMKTSSSSSSSSTSPLASIMKSLPFTTTSTTTPSSSSSYSSPQSNLKKTPMPILSSSESSMHSRNELQQLKEVLSLESAEQRLRSAEIEQMLLRTINRLSSRIARVSSAPVSSSAAAAANKNNNSVRSSSSSVSRRHLVSPAPDVVPVSQEEEERRSKRRATSPIMHNSNNNTNTSNSTSRSVSFLPDLSNQLDSWQQNQQQQQQQQQPQFQYQLVQEENLHRLPRPRISTYPPPSEMLNQYLQDEDFDNNHHRPRTLKSARNPRFSAVELSKKYEHGYHSPQQQRQQQNFGPSPSYLESSSSAFRFISPTRPSPSYSKNNEGDEEEKKMMNQNQNFGSPFSGSLAALQHLASTRPGSNKNNNNNSSNNAVSPPQSLQARMHQRQREQQQLEHQQAEREQQQTRREQEEREEEEALENEYSPNSRQLIDKELTDNNEWVVQTCDTFRKGSIVESVCLLTDLISGRHWYCSVFLLRRLAIPHLPELQLPSCVRCTLFVDDVIDATLMQDEFSVTVRIRAPSKEQEAEQKQLEMSPVRLARGQNYAGVPCSIARALGEQHLKLECETRVEARTWLELFALCILEQNQRRDAIEKEKRRKEQLAEIASRRSNSNNTSSSSRTSSVNANAASAAAAAG